MTDDTMRVTWKPSRNSEREALRRHPGPWLVYSHGTAVEVRGERCWLIWPPAKPQEVRWVPSHRIKFIPETAP